jgi:hypothetical protein
VRVRRRLKVKTSNPGSDWLQWFAFFIISCAVILCFAHQAKASELQESYTSVRALGMGNAYSAVADDSDALFYNPAGLAKNSAFRWTLFDPRAGINGMDTVNYLQQLYPLMLNSGNGSGLMAALNTMYGKRIWVGGGVKSAILLPNLAMAAYSSTDLGLYVQNPAATTMHLNYFFDYGIAVGGGVSLIPGVWRIGLTAKRINRTGTNIPIGPSELASANSTLLESEFKRRGNGYGLDLGTTFSVPGPVSPSLSFVYKNMGQTTFSHEEGAGAPPPIPPEFIIGSAVKFDAFLVSVTPSFDYTYVTDAGIQTGKKIHLGLEIDLPLIALRAGLNQGYYTLGAGLDMGPLRIDVATYGVELGEYPGQQEDRRYIAQLTFELGFDPGSFGLGGGGSSTNADGTPNTSAGKHKLKQRR